MTIIALGFIYPNKLTEFMETKLSDELVQSYRDDLDFQNIIDLVQQDLECCGISSDGFRDWSKNEYFNCTKTKEENPSVERCGVPYSCCLPDTQESGLVNLMCGFGVQLEKDFGKVSQRIFTKGCIPTIQTKIENNLYTVGGVAIGIALSQVK